MSGKKTKKKDHGYAELRQLSDNMLDLAIQALLYIAQSGSSVISLAGPNHAAADKQPPIEVARQCLGVLAGIVQGRDGVATHEGGGEVADALQIKDGGVIRFSDGFDGFHHECCKCGLVHFVELKWKGDRDLITEWTRLEGRPTKADLSLIGQVVDPSIATEA